MGAARRRARPATARALSARPARASTAATIIRRKMGEYGRAAAAAAAGGSTRSASASSRHAESACAGGAGARASRTRAHSR